MLARWQEFVGTGEFLRTLESRVGQLRDRMVAAITGRPAPGKNLQTALESQLVTLLRGVAADAAEQAYSAWQAHPAGAALLEPALQQPARDLPQRADRLVRDWQQWVLDLVRSEAGDKRSVARGRRVRGQWFGSDRDGRGLHLDRLHPHRRRGRGRRRHHGRRAETARGDLRGPGDPHHGRRAPAKTC